MSTPDETSAATTVSTAVQLPAPDPGFVDDGGSRWILAVDQVPAVTMVSGPYGVVVRIERGQDANPFRGVHARAGQLTADVADELGRCLIAAAADARARCSR